ncbi:MAG TPA: IS1634 family transposase [Anaeromyxobacteraceae bacterium]|nr:IS1634 family transposase [Anaeromyxobacteraceae bacterium]
MFLRESRHKRSSGQTVVYLQLAESVWNPATSRPETRIVYNFGRADDAAVRLKLEELARGILRRVVPEELTQGGPDWKLVDAWPYGDLYVLEQLWDQVGLSKLLPRLTKDETQSELPVERACFAMVANRCCAPASKLYCFEQWLREDVHLEGGEDLELQHLYRSMDFFEKHKEELEKELYFRVADLFSVDVDLVFYDATTLHCEIDEEDAGGAEGALMRGSRLAGGKTYEALRQRGKSKNKRSDVPQVIVGMAMTRDGLPIRSWVFRGDTVDVETVEKVKQDLRGWKLTRSIFVGDAGMVSKENLKTLSAGGGKYILCMPISPGNEVTKLVLTRAGRYRRVAENLEVKEVTLGDGEGRRRYAVCFNPQEAKRQEQHREKVLAELHDILPSLKASHEDGAHSKETCRLRASERYGSYLSLDERGRLQIDEDKVRRKAKNDGTFVVHSNDDTLSAEDLALGYKQLADVERAWRLLKGGLRIRPMFHFKPHRISAHVSLSMISLLLTRVVERACGETWRNVRDDLRQVKLAQLLTPNGAIWQVTEPSEAARKWFKPLGIAPPGPVLRVDS